MIQDKITHPTFITSQITPEEVEKLRFQINYQLLTDSPEVSKEISASCGYEVELDICLNPKRPKSNQMMSVWFKRIGRATPRPKASLLPQTQPLPFSLKKHSFGPLVYLGYDNFRKEGTSRDLSGEAQGGHKRVPVFFRGSVLD